MDIKFFIVSVETRAGEKGAIQFFNLATPADVAQKTLDFFNTPDAFRMTIRVQTEELE